jgi:hypothetical protein
MKMKAVEDGRRKKRDKKHIENQKKKWQMKSYNINNNIKYDESSKQK